MKSEYKPELYWLGYRRWILQPPLFISGKKKVFNRSGSTINQHSNSLQLRVQCRILSLNYNQWFYFQDQNKTKHFRDTLPKMCVTINRGYLRCYLTDTSATIQTLVTIKLLICPPGRDVLQIDVKHWWQSYWLIISSHIQACLVKPDWSGVAKVSGLSWIPDKQRTIQSRSTIASPEYRPVYCVLWLNGVRYSKTCL